MFGRFAGNQWAALIAAVLVLLAAGIAGIGAAEAFGGRHERGYGRPVEGWRPIPPLVHGYWGQRRWQRYNDGFDGRPPSPRLHYGYDHGWR